MTEAESPQAAFAQFVRRAVDDGKVKRGWSITSVAMESGVGRSTLFRWLAGDWIEFPALAKVRDFCDALDIPVVVALRALQIPDRAGAGGRPDQQVRRDIQVIVNGLADPLLPAVHKRRVRESLHRLAVRVQTRTADAPPAPRGRRRAT